MIKVALQKPKEYIMRDTSEILNDMVQIELAEGQSFLIVKETLSRIGIQNWARKTLYQSVHILQKQGNYYLAHFKTLLELDGNEAHLDSDDHDRLLDIAALMSKWNLVTLVDKIDPPNKNKFRVLKKADSDGWELVAKFTIGKFKKRGE
jgi:hypothetical protein